MNQRLANEGRRILKELLSQCTDGQQLMFKRMYSHTNLELPINEVVDKMDEQKIDNAISQCEKTLEKNGVSIHNNIFNIYDLRNAFYAAREEHEYINLGGNHIENKYTHFENWFKDYYEKDKLDNR